MKIAFITLGCKLNQCETETIAAGFAAKGFEVSVGAPAASPADIIFINTCTVTSKAEQKARRIIRAALKTANLVIVSGCYAELNKSDIEKLDSGGRLKVVGISERETIAGLVDSIVGSGQWVVGSEQWVVGSEQRVEGSEQWVEGSGQWVEGSGQWTVGSEQWVVGSILSSRKQSTNECNNVEADIPDTTPATGNQQPATGNRQPATGLLLTTHYPLPTNFRSRPFIKIQDGCGRACAYCRTVLARGKSVSVPPQTILAALSAYEKAGALEAVLTGVNIGQYSVDSGQGTVDSQGTGDRGQGTGDSQGTVDSPVTGCRLPVGSDISNTKPETGNQQPATGTNLSSLLGCLLDNTQKIALRLSSLEPEAFTQDFIGVFKNDRIRPHIHISAQSGCARILRAMGRGCAAVDMLETIEQLRGARNDPFIACDIIAGFPGEDDGAFAETLDFCKKARFAWIHAFPYSPRPGTAAYTMKNRPPESEAVKRVAALTALAKHENRAYIERWIERGGTLNAVPLTAGKSNTLTLLTENYIKVKIPSSGTKTERCRLTSIDGEGIVWGEFV
ncbi:MAG: hypothetical protein LBG72_01180 [Spirochaetaceae bacterium]|nr:hypothetical protein [Spirochaetaceae bacterium]